MRVASDLTRVLSARDGAWALESARFSGQLPSVFHPRNQRKGEAERSPSPMIGRGF